MKSSSSGQAIVEWALCVPVLIALVSFLFAFMFLMLAQFQLEDLCARTADKLARSASSNLSLLEANAQDFVRAHSNSALSVHIDVHVVDEPPTSWVRPPIEVIGVQLTRPLGPVNQLQLRAYARAARVS